MSNLYCRTKLSECDERRGVHRTTSVRRAHIPEASLLRATARPWSAVAVQPAQGVQSARPRGGLLSGPELRRRHPLAAREFEFVEFVCCARLRSISVASPICVVFSLSVRFSLAARFQMSEDEAFEMMKHLLFFYGLRKQYKPDMSALQVREHAANVICVHSRSFVFLRVHSRSFRMPAAFLFICT